MNNESKYIEVKEYNGEGYMPVIDFEKWRVAVLNYCDELKTENIFKMQKHDLTDEVFVLLQGEFILFIGEGDNSIIDIKAVRLEPNKMYNIKKGTWHTHTLSRDASVLIVENSDTNDGNSPQIEISEKLRGKMLDLAGSMIGY